MNKYIHTHHSNGSVTASKVEVLKMPEGGRGQAVVMREDGRGVPWTIDVARLENADYGYAAPERHYTDRD